MPRHSRKLRESAREMYLTGEVTSVSEIARRLKVKPHTVGIWKKEEDWDILRIKIDKQAAEKLVDKIASDRVTLNAQHFRMWGLIISETLQAMQRTKDLDVRDLERFAATLERAQKGQRLARGLSLDGQTEEQIRAQAESDSRAVVDLVLEVIKEKVTDEGLRDEIAKALLSRMPQSPDEQAS